MPSQVHVTSQAVGSQPVPSMLPQPLHKLDCLAQRILGRRQLSTIRIWIFLPAVVGSKPMSAWRIQTSTFQELSKLSSMGKQFVTMMDEGLRRSCCREPGQTCLVTSVLMRK